MKINSFNFHSNLDISDSDFDPLSGETGDFDEPEFDFQFGFQKTLFNNLDKNIYISEISFLRLKSQKDTNFIEADKLDFANDLKELNQAYESDQLLIDALLSNGQRVQKTSPNVVQLLKSVHEIHIYDHNKKPSSLEYSGYKYTGFYFP